MTGRLGERRFAMPHPGGPGPTVAEGGQRGEGTWVHEPCGMMVLADLGHDDTLVQHPRCQN